MSPKEITIDSKGLKLKEVNSQIRDAANKGSKVSVVNAEHLCGIASGLQGGEMTINGKVSDYTAFLNDGARIVVEGDTGSFVGDNSRDGEIIVKGSADYGAGIYSCGGTIVIYGNAGDAAGQMFKGGVLIIGGDVGAHVGLYMVGGEIVIVGNSGKRLGDFMIRGNIYLGGECETLGNNAKYEKMASKDFNRLSLLFKKYWIDADVNSFKKIVPVCKRPFG